MSICRDNYGNLSVALSQVRNLHAIKMHVFLMILAAYITRVQFKSFIAQSCACPQSIAHPDPSHLTQPGAVSAAMRCRQHRAAQPTGITAAISICLSQKPVCTDEIDAYTGGCNLCNLI